MANLKKHWVPVLAPSIFKNEPLGESYVLETSSLKGRGISVNLMNITGEGSAEGLMANPVSVYVDEEENVYVADSSKTRAMKFDSNGNLLAAWGTSGTGDGAFNNLYSISGSDGAIFVGALNGLVLIGLGG